MCLWQTLERTFSIRLKPGVKKRLAKLAKASGRSSNFLISDAVESYVVDQERLQAKSAKPTVKYAPATISSTRI